jgi:hypothetical protein
MQNTQNMKNIKFVGDTAENLAYQPTKFKDSFYQICQFKNPKTNLFSVRKVFFDEKYEIIDVFEKEYDTKTIKKFIKNNDNNKYRVFPTNDLSYLAYPNSSDFMNVHSDLTNKKISAQWNNMACYDSYDQYNYGGMVNTHTMASPGVEISKQRRPVGSASKEFYNGEPSKENLMRINNNLVG